MTPVGEPSIAQGKSPTKFARDMVRQMGGATRRSGPLRLHNAKGGWGLGLPSLFMVEPIAALGHPNE